MLPKVMKVWRARKLLSQIPRKGLLNFSRPPVRSYLGDVGDVTTSLSYSSGSLLTSLFTRGLGEGFSPPGPFFCRRPVFPPHREPEVLCPTTFDFTKCPRPLPTASVICPRFPDSPAGFFQKAP